MVSSTPSLARGTADSEEPFLAQQRQGLFASLAVFDTTKNKDDRRRGFYHALIT